MSMSIWFALVVAALLWVFARSVHAADIQVQPGQSLRDAVMRARPGDRVLVHAGTYAGGGWIGPIHGTPDAWITVLAVDGPRTAVIQGGAEALRIGDASSYLVFDGFEVRGSSNNAIHIDGLSHHITLRNLYAHDAGLDGDVLKVNQCHDVTVETSEFARPGRRAVNEGNPYQECLDFLDVDNTVWRGNFVHDAGSMLAFVKGGSRHVVIDGNLFADARAGASDPMVGLGGSSDLALLQGEQYEAFDVVFRNNVLAHGPTGALAVYDCSGCYVADNLFVDNDRVLVEFRAGSGPAAASDDVRLVNNVFADTRGRMPPPLLLSSHALRGLVATYGLFWNAGATVPATSVLALAQQPGYLVADPRVAPSPVGASRAQLLQAVRPSAPSPAAGSGADVAGAPFGAAMDFDGVLRAGRLDRGPFVLSAPVPPPAPVPPACVSVPTQPASCACTCVCAP